MTISTTNVKTPWVAANGVNKTWSYDFPIYAAGEAYLEYKNGVNGTIISTQANVAFNPASDLNSGSLTYPVSGPALAGTYFVRVRRVVPLTQIVALGNQGTFRPEIHERAFNRSTMQVQQIKDAFDELEALVNADLAAIAALVEDAEEATAAVAADRIVVAADKATVAADKAIVEADKATVAGDKATVASDKATVAADKGTTQGYMTTTSGYMTTTLGYRDAVITLETLVEGYRDEVEADRVSVQADKVIAAAAADTAVAAQAAAEAALASTLAAYDAFDDRYLGAKNVAPTVDNDGNALVSGALYYHNGVGMQVWNGAAWVAAYISGGSYASLANNGSDYVAATFRTNLDLYSTAETLALPFSRTAKTTLVDADTIGITDSAASNVWKKITWANFKTQILAYFNGTAKATPIDADRVWLGNSTTSNTPVYSTLTQFKAFLKAYFDTIYALAAHSHAFADITTKPTTVAGYGITDVAFTKSYTSGQLTISNAGAHTLTHGLGTVPKLVVVEAICLTAELGWSVGDVAYVGSFYVNGVGLTFLLSRTATDIGVKFVNGSAPLYLLHKSTGSGSFATSANWRLIVSAYA